MVKSTYISAAVAIAGAGKRLASEGQAERQVPAPKNSSFIAEIGGEDNTENLIHPDYPSTWPATSSVAINIGLPIDPDDASSWAQSTESVNIGQPIDPDDSSTWAVPSSGQKNMGKFIDPEDRSTWPVPSKEVVNIGEPLDPDFL